MTYKTKEPQPSRFCKWLIKRIFRDEGETKLGDFMEIYGMLAEEEGELQTRLKFWGYLSRSIPRYIKDSLCMGATMFKNYLKIAFRNIKQHKGYSFINISGLAIGMACFLLIFVYVRDELSFDRFYKNGDRIFRIAMEIKKKSSLNMHAHTSVPLVPAIRENFPEVENAARILKPWWRNVVKHKNEMFAEDRLFFADNEIFQILSIRFIQGDPATALARPTTIVLTKQMAQKYFGYEYPIGKSIDINGSDWEVTGIVENAPKNTHFKYDLILSFKNIEKSFDLSNWGWLAFYAYVKLAQNANADVFEDKIHHFADNYIEEKLKEWGEEYTYFLQPVADIHLNSNLLGEIEPPGNPMFVTIFSSIGILILMIACINFMNLATAQSTGRARDGGIRKVLGAIPLHLIGQFFVESLCITFLALLASISIVFVTLPFFNVLSGKNFTLSDLFQFNTFFILLGLAVFVGIVSGSYPAFQLSLCKPVNIFKGSLGISLKGTTVRKILVIGQFSISIILILGTIVISSQVDFMKNKYLGFNKEQKLIIPARFNNNYEYIKTQFLQHPSILGVTAVSSVPGRLEEQYSVYLLGQDNDKAQSMNFLFVDHDFIPEYNIELIAGRPFQQEKSTDIIHAFVINEAAAKSLGFDSPNKAIDTQLRESGQSNVGTIIGVAKDFHYKGVQSIIEPLVLQMRPDRYSLISLTLEIEDFKTTLEYVEKKWHELQLGDLFTYFFLDEDFNSQYGSEEKTGRFFIAFAILAIFISCLGILGLASFTVQKRTKEIGVRKILGASITQIAVMLSWEYLKWIILANIVALPISYFVAKKWLQSFAFRIDLWAWPFIISGMAAVCIAQLTVSYQSIKAATANPVDSLRYE